MGIGVWSSTVLQWDCKWVNLFSFRTLKSQVSVSRLMVQTLSASRVARLSKMYYMKVEWM